MWQRSTLRMFCISEQSTCCSMSMTELVGIPCGQVGHIELLDQFAVTQTSFVLKIGPQRE